MQRSISALIADILGLFEDNQSLVYQVNRLEEENARLRSNVYQHEPETPEQSSLTLIEKAAYETGRKKIYEDATRYNYSNVELEQRDGSLELQPTPFETWRRHFVRDGKIPDFISRDDFEKFFDPELRHDYDKAVHEAMEEQLKKSEEE